MLMPLHTMLATAAGTYAANNYSNKRWCCGDRDHFDISAWAFEKLADKKWGVIGECEATLLQDMCQHMQWWMSPLYCMVCVHSVCLSAAASWRFFIRQHSSIVFLLFSLPPLPSLLWPHTFRYPVPQGAL
jgi:hypothetical protein